MWEWMESEILEFVMDRVADAFSLSPLYPEEPGWYSWWSYRAGARARNVGWRIDYFCVSNPLAPRVKGAAIPPDVTGSDHCPVSLEIDC